MRLSRRNDRHRRPVRVKVGQVQSQPALFSSPDDERPGISNLSASGNVRCASHRKVGETRVDQRYHRCTFGRSRHLHILAPTQISVGELASRIPLRAT